MHVFDRLFDVTGVQVGIHHRQDLGNVGNAVPRPAPPAPPFHATEETDFPI